MRLTAMVEPARTIALPPSPGYPLYVSAKCYRPQQRAENSNRDISLIFLHGVGSYKEVFEPVIVELLVLWNSSRLRIREVWSVECPNHGQSAVLNEHLLRRPEWDGKCEYEVIQEPSNVSDQCRSSSQSLLKSTPKQPTRSSTRMARKEWSSTFATREWWG